MKITLSKPIAFSPQNQRDKRRKSDLREVFNPDEDDSNTQVKKRKLVPLGIRLMLFTNWFVTDDNINFTKKNSFSFYWHTDYSEDKKSKKDTNNKDGCIIDDKLKPEDSVRSQEEKRKHIKSLIEKIPTEKDALFAYQLDWGAIDNSLMERKIRPWINKKIIEYIGEPEPTLVDFICSKVLAGSQPQIILQDVQMVCLFIYLLYYYILCWFILGIRWRGWSVCCENVETVNLWSWSEKVGPGQIVMIV